MLHHLRRSNREGNYMREGWWPIATAPKDGTHILGYDPLGEARVVIRWDEIGAAWIVCWDGSKNADVTDWCQIPDEPK